MIKTHNKTGLKYLCITKKENWISYTGSGVYWKNHLKAHGNDIHTDLLFESDNYDVFVKECIRYSDLYDVVNSDSFANTVPEMGYNNSIGKSNLDIWWEFATDDMKRDVIEKRRKTMIEWYKNNTINVSESTKKKLSQIFHNKSESEKEQIIKK